MTVSDNMFFHVNMLIHQNASDKKLERLLKDCIREVFVRGDILILVFNSGLKVALSSFYDEYHLYISSIDMYEKEDSPFNLYSSDRVYYYLSKICKEELGGDISDTL